ncbi:hypothetical protein [Burkholderia gladioli]|uniref:hypothetical protein n=1 Tax=Burkholderia gladioli TaxID=28095 RepID=UPI001641B5BE|nr:hypothetical protein [Burkholderia gladioli]
MGALLSQSIPASAGIFSSGDAMFQEFPMWVTHDAGESRLVETEAAFAALGDGWKKPEQPQAVPREKQPDFAEYPKWVAGAIVHSAAEEAALSPSASGSEDAPQSGEDERTVLLQIAEEKGLKVDKRWSNDKIRTALEAA